MPRSLASVSLPDPSALIVTIRGHRVILDADLAFLYGVSTKAFNQAIKRNTERFPESFAFQLSTEEWEAMRSQNVTASKRNVRFLPFAFTEHGALMAANVLNSARAITMSVALVETFIKLRQMALSVEELTRKVGILENHYDEQFKIVFDAIRQLLEPPETPTKEIGFHTTK